MSLQDGTTNWSHDLLAGPPTLAVGADGSRLASSGNLLARPADAAPAESRHTDAAAQQHRHQVGMTPGTAASPSDLSRASQFALLV